MRHVRHLQRTHEKGSHCSLSSHRISLNAMKLRVCVKSYDIVQIAVSHAVIKVIANLGSRSEPKVSYGSGHASPEFRAAPVGESGPLGPQKGPPRSPPPVFVRLLVPRQRTRGRANCGAPITFITTGLVYIMQPPARSINFRGRRGRDPTQLSVGEACKGPGRQSLPRASHALPRQKHVIYLKAWGMCLFDWCKRPV